MDLALNNLQRLICHKNQPTNQPPFIIFPHHEYNNLPNTYQLPI